jgi:hypothetical protein
MRRAINFVIGLATFAACCAGLHRALPPPYLSQVTPKLRFLREHRADFDTIFIGSSRVFRGIAPAVFDRTMAESGCPTRSFNLGIDGMWPPEQFLLIERVLAMRPTTWRTVFIELNDVQVTLMGGSEGTQRAVYWHDWDRTRIIFCKLLAIGSGENTKRKVRLLVQWRSTLWLHADLLFKNLTNVGAAESLVETFRPHPDDAGELGPLRDGYDPAELHLEGAALQKYEQWLAQDEPNARPRTVDAYAQQAYLDYARQFQLLGATPVFFTAPGPTSLLPSKFSVADAPPVLAFNDARAYPSLYRPEMRRDESHVNAHGAEEFTRIFAQRVLTLAQPPK